jgi:hypothetical protein
VCASSSPRNSTRTFRFVSLKLQGDLPAVPAGGTLIGDGRRGRSRRGCCFRGDCRLRRIHSASRPQDGAQAQLVAGSYLHRLSPARGTPRAEIVTSTSPIRPTAAHTSKPKSKTAKSESEPSTLMVAVTHGRVPSRTSSRTRSPSLPAVPSSRSGRRFTHPSTVLNASLSLSSSGSEGSSTPTLRCQSTRTCWPRGAVQ